MRDAIETLKQEHRLIKEVLASFETFLDRLGGGADDRATLLRFTEFFRLFMMKFHAAKEEELLFRQIFIYGFPSNLGPLADMLSDHVDGQKRCVALARIAGQPGAFSHAEREDLSRSGRRFIDLVVESCVVVEIKAVSQLEEIHGSQVVSYLRATGLRAVLLVNFNKPMLKAGIRRIVL